MSQVESGTAQTRPVVGGKREEACPLRAGPGASGGKWRSEWLPGSQEVALRECEGDREGEGPSLGPPGEQALGPPPRAQCPLGGDCGHSAWSPRFFTSPESGIWGPMGEEGKEN